MWGDEQTMVCLSMVCNKLILAQLKKENPTIGSISLFRGMHHSPPPTESSVGSLYHPKTVRIKYWAYGVVTKIQSKSMFQNKACKTVGFRVQVLTQDILSIGVRYDDKSLIALIQYIIIAMMNSWMQAWRQTFYLTSNGGLATSQQ